MTTEQKVLSARIANEAGIQRFIRNLIESGGFLEKINGTADVKKAAQSLRNAKVIPGLSIDLLQREQMVLAADEALSALNNLKIVSDNTSISRRTGEILRPDFVLFNEEQGKLVLVELKDDAMPERQAVTELLAYERELRNHFPFLSQRQVVFVLIARDWTDLLNHAAAGLTARGRPAFVGLTVSGDAPDLHLKARTDEAWTRLYQLHIKPDALLSRSYRLSFPDCTEEDALIALLNATDLMRQAADRAGQHGFCVTWRHPGEAWLGITLYTVDPAHLHIPASPDSQFRKSELTEFFEAFLTNEGLRYDSGLDAILDTLRNALEPDVVISHVRDGHWTGDLTWLEGNRALPLAIRYWGMLADFSIRAGTGEAAKRHFTSGSLLGIDDARAGYQIITAITGSQPFKGGRITAQPLFDIAVLLRKATDNALSPDPDLVSWYWTNFKLLPYCSEIGYLIGSWIDSIAINRPLPLFSAIGPDTAAKFISFYQWLNSIFSKHPLGAALHAGWTSAGTPHNRCYPGRAQASDDEMLCLSIADAIAQGEPSGIAWSELATSLPAGWRRARTPASLRAAIIGNKPGDGSIACLINIADKWIAPFKRRQSFIESVTVDIENLRHGIDDILRNSPKSSLPCLLIDADGMIGTCIINRPKALPSFDHGQQVAVLNRSSGRDLLIILDWAELSGGNFDVLASSVVGTPVTLEEWHSDGSFSEGPVNNLWHGGKINLTELGLAPGGPPGARFLNVAFSENSPAELAILINMAADPDTGSDGEAGSRFQMASGGLNHKATRIGFIALEACVNNRTDDHVILFDMCAPQVHLALDQLKRQACLHFVIASETGEVVAFEECRNVFGLSELADLCMATAPGPEQARAQEIITRDKTILTHEVKELIRSRRIGSG